LGLREDVGARLFKNVTGMTMESYRRLCRHDNPVVSRPTRPKSEPRLVLTESVIRQILSTSEHQSRVPSRQRTGIMIQGPSN
jgi:hypothetical protein